MVIKQKSIRKKIILLVGTPILAMLLLGVMDATRHRFEHHNNARLHQAFEDYLYFRSYMDGLNKTTLGVMFYARGQVMMGDNMIRIGTENRNLARPYLYKSSNIEREMVDDMVNIEFDLVNNISQAQELIQYMGQRESNSDPIEDKRKKNIFNHAMSTIGALNDAIELYEVLLRNELKNKIEFIKTDIERVSRKVNIAALFLVVFIVAGVIVMVIRSIYSFSNSLSNLLKATALIQNGQFDTHVDVITNDEIGELATSFNAMVVQLSSNKKINEEANKSLQLHADELRILNEHLQTTTEQLEYANLAKSQFLANMSHEIRTPLNAIIGYSELLVETAEDQCLTEVLSDAGKIRYAGNHLFMLINDILDLSKIEANCLELENVSFVLRENIQGIIDIFAKTADEKGLFLQCHIDESIPAVVQGDPTRLRQIVTNLIGNAIKFTESGSVVLVAKLQEQSAHTVQLYLAVADTGVGISKVVQEKIFESFSQADESTARQYGGTGLGLTISKRLSEMMNGTIGVDSQLGKGSTFWFTVTLKKN